MSSAYSVGIDLGTTNSVVAYVPLDDEKAPVRLLEIPQLTSAATVENRAMLPSFMYVAPEAERGSYDLPWATGREFAVGEWARLQAASVPTRTVAAAKSWLCHSRIDRSQAILPWNAPDTVRKVSPVEVSQRYLEHLVVAWDLAHPEAPLHEQKVTLTVPASFDASARDLTREAAHRAGLPEDMVLLEEPQAALYAWLAAAGESWRRQLQVGDVLLVCDVGGGTTDFTLIRVEEADGDLQLTRVAVGNHILVGGDNMDLALAHLAKTAFQEKGIEIDAWQSVSLWHAARLAKEALLSENGPEQHPVTVLGRGSRLVGGTISIDLKREPVLTALVDGFLPKCPLGTMAARRRASGFRELGLPFEADAAITHHLSQFLTQHAEAGAAAVRPTHIVFNGGVFKSGALRGRLTEVFGDWFGVENAPTVLEGSLDLDFAVARGAAYYGRAKISGGIRIRGGTARAYYVGIETSGPAVPGAPRPLRALCVVPHGMEEGTSADVPGEEIGLVVGEPAHFRFFSSSVRKADRPGEVVEHWTEEELIETDSMEAALQASSANEEGYVPVRFESRITELGVLELWCVGTRSDERWKLEFSVRGDAQA